MTTSATPTLTPTAPTSEADHAAVLEDFDLQDSPPAVEPSRPLAALENLNVWFTDDAGGHRHVVHGLSLEIHPGECVAVIGESGSGKSVTARTLVGLTGPGSLAQASHASLGEHRLEDITDQMWRTIRGREVGFILQDALVSLDPLRPVGAEISEALRLHGVSSSQERQRKVVQLLESVGVPDPQARAQQRPDELSGGLRQRALIASAIANDPPLLIADEPTTALDVTVQAQVLDLLAERRAAGTALLLISHDFSVVGKLADRVLVMQGGRIVEQGTAHQVLTAPQHSYTRQLLEALPSGGTKGTYLTESARLRADQRAQRSSDTGDGPAQQRGKTDIALRASGLTKAYRGPDGLARTVVDDVSFDVPAGSTLGIVGESGSGKSTTAAMLLGLTSPDQGTVDLHGQPWSQLSVADRRARRREMTVVYQDPLSSFDPRWNAERILIDALEAASPNRTAALWRSRAHTARLRQGAAHLAELVGLAEEHLSAHPSRLSGGQRQRLAIARALAPEPEVVVLDEAVSALDVSVQAQVLDLLSELQETLGLTYVFISHDLGVIHHLSDHILVMQDGHAVEIGEADQVFHHPAHPYTSRLLGSLQALNAHLPGAAHTGHRIPAEAR